jgi:hypothetical protein
MDGIEFFHELAAMVFRAVAVAFVVMLVAYIIVGHFASIGWEFEGDQDPPITLGETSFRH